MKEFFRLASRQMRLLIIVSALILTVVAISTYSLVKVAGAQAFGQQLPEVKDKKDILTSNPSPADSDSNINKIKTIIPVSGGAQNITGQSSTAKSPKPVNNSPQIDASPSNEPSGGIDIDDDVEDQHDEIESEQVEPSSEPDHK